jgi:hypothetical protein
MSIYPDDATISPIIAFNTIAIDTYNNTASTTIFNLTLPISFVGEVVATIDGVVQETTSYYISNSGNSVSFLIAPNATELVLKTISLPARFRTTRTYPAIYSSSFSNTNITTINSNNYILNGVATSFALPLAALDQINDANSLIITISGVVQDFSAFTWPSSVLSINGIDLPEALANAVINPDYANVTLEIRTLIPSVEVLGRFNDMRDRKPDNGYGISRKYNTTSFSTQNGYEKRRLLSRRTIRDYNLTYTNITGVEKQAIENFYNLMSGEYETFTFDLAHLNSSGTVRTRFNGPLEINHVHSIGAGLSQNFYTVNLKLIEDFS